MVPFLMLAFLLLPFPYLILFKKGISLLKKLIVVSFVEISLFITVRILSELLGDKDSQYIEDEISLILFFGIFVGVIVVINIIWILILLIIRKLIRVNVIKKD